MIKLHPTNIGKVIVTNGKRSKISWISVSGEYFRLESDLTEAIQYDYRFEDIVQTQDEILVLIKAPTWQRVSLSPVQL